MAELTEKMKADLAAGVKVRLWPEETEREFHGFDELRQYIQAEADAWHLKHNAIAQRFKAVAKLLGDSVLDGPKERNRDDAWKTATQLLCGERQAGFQVIYSSTKAGKFVLGLPESKDGLRRVGAVDVIFGSRGDGSPSPQNGDDYLVYQLGMFEAWLELRSEAAVQRKVEQAEKATIASQAAFDAFVADCQQTRSKKEADFDEVRSRRDGELGTALGKWNEGLAEQQEKWTRLLAAADTDWTEKAKDAEHRLLEWHVKCSVRMGELEALYAEKLSLEKPAVYWDNLRKRHTGTFRVSGLLAALLTVWLTNALLSVLNDWPEILGGSGWSVASAKGTVLLLTVISLGVFVISILTRICLSSLHLARDAEERYQLTYVYLALLKEKAFADETMKPIVLQALFSRADTGLLKGDSSPTMPVVQVLQALKKD